VLRARVVTLKKVISRLNAKHEHGGKNRLQGIPARSRVQNRPKHEIRRERRGQPPDHKVGHKAPNIRLESCQPRSTDSAPWQRYPHPERTDPAKQRLQGKEHDRPEHPLRETPADDKANPTTFAAQADSG